MGRIVTPTYRVEYRDNSQPQWKPMIWDCKLYGRPTMANLEAWRQGYNRSFGPDGHNWHVSQAVGYVIHINRARIIRQKSGEIMAAVTMPLFEVA